MIGIPVVVGCAVNYVTKRKARDLADIRTTKTPIFPIKYSVHHCNVITNSHIEYKDEVETWLVMSR